MRFIRKPIGALAGAWILVFLVSACSAPGPDTGEIAGAPSRAPQPRDGSERLLVECGQKVKSPGTDAIAVDTSGDGYGTSAGVSADSHGLTYGVILDNQSDFLAVGVEFSLLFIGDGEDVTDELGDDFEEKWDGGKVVVDSLDSGRLLLGTSSIEKPDGWEDLDLKLEAEVTGVDYWCTYEEPGPYSG